VRVLDVSPRVVSLRVGGSQARIANLMARLAERHELRSFAQPRLHELRAGAPGEHVNRSVPAALFTELGERTWPSAPILCGAALRLGGTRALRELMCWADVAIVEFPWQFAACARAADGCRVVLATHNVEADKFDSYARAAGARLTRGPWLRYVERVEREAVRRADLVLAVSQADADGLTARYGADPARTVLVPNGADTDALTPAEPERRTAARRSLGLQADRPVALYAGADVTPNRRGLEWVRALAKRTDRFTFLVVGAVGGRPRREGNMVVTGWIRDFGVALDAADVSLCPIEFGGGTKVKLIESLAAGLPIVAFAAATKGTVLRDGEELLVVPPSLDGLEAALDRIARDGTLASRLGAAARRHAEEHHDWNAIAARLERALVELV
jgi:glycosyltransferase involved in cell wall biosynthesis